MQLQSSLRVLLVLPALLLLALPQAVPAQCPGVCGDLNGNGSVTSADVIELAEWVHRAIPPTGSEACGDVDEYLGVTVRDAVWLTECIFKCDFVMFDCDPDFGAFVATPDDQYEVTYTHVFPAGDSTFTLALGLIHPEDLLAVTLPLRVLVDGETPALSNLVTAIDPVWDYHAGRFDLPGAPSGHLLLGFQRFLNPLPRGSRKLAQIQLHMAPVAHDRPITLEWIDLPPANTPMAVTQDLGGWEPSLLPCLVTQTGDVNWDDAITSADIIWLVSHVFAGGFAPLPCQGTGDVNCSGTISSADVIWLVNYVFKGGERPCNVCALIGDGIWTCP